METKLNLNESKNNRKDTKSRLLLFSINVHHWIHSRGPTSVLLYLFLTTVDQPKESVKKFFNMNNFFLKIFVDTLKQLKSNTSHPKFDPSPPSVILFKSLERTSNSSSYEIAGCKFFLLNLCFVFMDIFFLATFCLIWFGSQSLSCIICVCKILVSRRSIFFV